MSQFDPGERCVPNLPYNRDLRTQIDGFLQLVLQNPIIRTILERASELNMPNWYLGAGCLAQTVWNAAHGFDLTFGIRDYDLVYFDSSDLTYEAEGAVIEKARELFDDLGVTVEVRNEARVHLWYEKRFGYPIAPYESAEHAINTWPTTATSIGIRSEPDSALAIYAPFGLSDLLGMTVRPNKAQITKEIYSSKVERWVRMWPRLRIVPWE